MDPFDDSFYADTVQVVSPIDTRDPDAGPVQGEGAGVTFAAAVQRVTVPRRLAEQETIHAVGDYDVLFAVDPGVVRPDMTLRWLANASGAFVTPIILHSLSRAEPPGGLCVRWTVPARMVS